MYSPPLVNLAILITCLACLCLPDAQARLRQAVLHPAGALALLFLAVATAWGFMGEPRPALSIASDWWSWRKLLWFVVVLMLFDEDKWKDRLLVAFVLGALPGLLLSDMAAMKALGLSLEAERLLRNTGTQGVAFATAALICFWMLLQPHHSPRQRGLWALGLAAFALNVFFVSIARSAYLQILVSILVVGALSMRRRQLLLLSGTLVVATACIFFTSNAMQHRLAQGISEWKAVESAPHSSSLGLRHIFYTHSIQVVRQNALTGVGTGGFASAYMAEVKKHNYPAGDWRAEPAHDPHNQFLHIWIDQGLLGLLVFLAWVSAIAVQTRSAQRYRALAAGLVLAWCVTSLFSSHFRTFAEGHLFATLAAALIAAHRPLPRAASSNPQASYAPRAS